MKPRFSSRLIIFSLIVTILVSGWLYRDSFSAYFFQDDWFTFRISNAKSIGEFLSFFIPRTDVIYYRPLGMQIQFFLLKSLFGINPIPFRILTFLTHAINIVLVFFLIKLLSKKNEIALLSSFLYGTSSAHYTIFYWSSIYPFIAGPTAFFLSFIFYLLFLERNKKNYYFLSLTIFILGLLINEMVAVLPIILFLYLLIVQNKIELRSFLPHISFIVLLFVVRFVVFPPPVSGVYQLGIGRWILNNLEAYLLWSFNWPEEMKAQLINFVTINPQFIRDFAGYFWIFIITLLINVSFLFIIPLMLIIRKKNKNYFKLILLSTNWFIVGLLLVIFFSHHTFSYYLSISLVGLLFIPVPLFSYLVEKIYGWNKVFAYIFIVFFLGNWLLASITTVDFNAKVHWAPRRAKISRQLVDKAKKFYKGESFVYIPFSSENKLALNDQDGLKVAFNNGDVVTVYK